MDKKQLRKEAKDFRRSITKDMAKESSRAIMDRLFSLPCMVDADVVFSFVSTKDEISTYDIMNEVLRQGKVLAVPLVIGKDMVFQRILSLEELKEGYYGIFEPENQKDRVMIPSHKDIILVPGLLYDRRGYRIGYGGGFYDKYFEKYPDGIRIGVLYHGQLRNQIEEEPFDQPLDCLITELECIEITH